VHSSNLGLASRNKFTFVLEVRSSNEQLSVPPSSYYCNSTGCDSAATKRTHLPIIGTWYVISEPVQFLCSIIGTLELRSTTAHLQFQLHHWALNSNVI